MNVRIAVGSSDGKTVDQHFGRAVQFILVDLDTESGEQKHAGSVRPQASNSTGVHDENRLLATFRLLEGCRAVLVSNIGPGAQNAVQAHGLAVFCTNGKMEDALAKLAKSKYFMTLACGPEKKDEGNRSARIR